MTRVTRERLMRYYRAMHERWGDQHWWPGETPTEVMVGAVLTQNTAWANVERAIAALKAADAMDLGRLHELGPEGIAPLIRPAGTFRVKARRLWHLAAWFVERLDADFQKADGVATEDLRRELLAVHGIGPETADAILLYAFARPAFVVDAYTLRVFHRHGLIAPPAGYDEAQRLALRLLPANVALWNDYHAQLVQVGKAYCRTRPRCEGCPLRRFLPKGSRAVEGASGRQ